MVILASFILDLFFSVLNSNYIASAVSRPRVHLWWMHNCVARLPTTARFHLALSMFVNQLLGQERKKWRLLSAYIYYQTVTGEKCNALFPARTDYVRGGHGHTTGSSAFCVPFVAPVQLSEIVHVWNTKVIQFVGNACWRDCLRTKYSWICCCEFIFK